MSKSHSEEILAALWIIVALLARPYGEWVFYTIMVKASICTYASIKHAINKR